MKSQILYCFLPNNICMMLILELRRIFICILVINFHKSLNKIALIVITAHKLLMCVNKHCQKFHALHFTMRRRDLELLQTIWKVSVPSSGPLGTTTSKTCNGLIALRGPQPESASTLKLCRRPEDTTEGLPFLKMMAALPYSGVLSSHLR